MDWMTEVELRLKRGNQLLFAKDSVLLIDLNEVIQAQDRRTLALWAFELADEAVQALSERYPDETRLKTAVQLSRAWAAGNVKMNVAKQAILQAHTVAKELDSFEDQALCHAIGQACSVVHTSGHALGFPIYELTALVRYHGVPACHSIIEARMKHYMERIEYWSARTIEYEWATFMMKDNSTSQG
ncbi:putative immunity protein [Exiguobacterium chiriqhucha]|uniref:putative immunity protein n=1 Tax=Exiguobacterium chiriqhucha TaxID=1385984 RepID=UPI0007368B20|nr:hypothetical protein [Exiguobacterium chiriqhucha]